MDPRNSVCMSSLVVFFSAYQAYLEGKENCVTFIFIYELSLLLPWSGSTLCFLIPDVALAFMGVSFADGFINFFTLGCLIVVCLYR